MPAVATYWQFPDEEQQFFDFLRKTGNVMAIRSGPVELESELTPRPLDDYISKFDPDKLLLGLEGFANQRLIERVEVGGQHKIVVSAMQSCLISYMRGRFRNDRLLGQFNLSAYWTRLSDDGKTIVDKDPDFKKWGEKIFRWIRKATPEWHQYKGYRVTRRVKDAILKGEIEIGP